MEEHWLYFCLSGISYRNNPLYLRWRLMVRSSWRGKALGTKTRVLTTSILFWWAVSFQAFVFALQSRLADLLPHSWIDHPFGLSFKMYCLCSHSHGVPRHTTNRSIKLLLYTHLRATLNFLEGFRGSFDGRPFLKHAVLSFLRPLRSVLLNGFPTHRLHTKRLGHFFGSLWLFLHYHLSIRI